MTLPTPHILPTTQTYLRPEQYSDRSLLSPPYLRIDFSQSLDRQRPHELMPLTDNNGKPLPPNKCSNLYYRYTDTHETACVPNIWYNQTHEMRLHHWEWQVQTHKEALNVATRAYQMALKATGPFHNGLPLKRAQEVAARDVSAAQDRLDQMVVILDKVKTGEFI